MGIDIFTPHEYERRYRQYFSDDEWSRFLYVQQDLSDFTENKMRDILRRHWQIRPKQLDSVHYSPPCQTYSFAHHGNNPYRAGIKPRAGPSGAIARQHDAMNGGMLKTLGDFSSKA